VRTTLTLDEDLAALIGRIRRERGIALKTIVNEAIRRGLQQMAAPQESKRTIKTKSVALGDCLVGNIDDVAEVLANAEEESLR